MKFGMIIAMITLLLGQLVFWYGIPNNLEHIGQDKLKIDRSDWFWQGHAQVKPNLAIVPSLPSPPIIKLMEMGDAQFLFRIFGLRLQHAGDTFARVTPLKDYDYAALYDWWSALDGLDTKSDFIAAMVAYYYSATQNPKPQLPYVIKYLEEHSDRDPSAKWWWYAQAAYQAKHRLEDVDWAIRIADKMYHLPPELKVPIWARQMKAFYLEEKGEYAEACQLILNILDTHEQLDEGELNFIMVFIQERIHAMIKAQDAKSLGSVDPRCNPLIEIKRDELQQRKEILESS